MSRNDGGGEPGKSVLVRNLSYRSRMEDIRYAFEKFGDVRDVYMPRDYQTGSLNSSTSIMTCTSSRTKSRHGLGSSIKIQSGC
mmetsp:Transcript_51963/g.89449  ORF Transcript_51963/g.89449 Transcript_51963/m.89449 type:complete len:83 (+) Transcript_51963:45-293(+)